MVIDPASEVGESELSNPLITWFVPWQPAPILKVFPKGHLLRGGVAKGGLLVVSRHLLALVT